MSFTLDGSPILVVGDVMLDIYLQGTVERISPEAPVPVVRLQRRWTSPGGVGHVALQLAALGAEVTLASLVGQDAAAEDLRVSLSAGGVHDLLLLAASEPATIQKTRILSATSQQLLRLDQEPRLNDWRDLPNLLVAAIRPKLQTNRTIVISDYHKGTLPPRILTQLIDESRQSGIPVIVDPKKNDWTPYRGATVVTPNTCEVESAIGRALCGDQEFAEAAAQLRDRFDLGTVLVTRGSDGMTGVDEEGVFHVAAKKRAVADVTGAGDTVVAVLGAALAARMPIRIACEWAATAAGIAVSKPGTYVVSLEEIFGDLGGLPAKLVSWQQAQRHVQHTQSIGQKVVFTNGCFDLLHAGHLHSLRQAREYGDLLVVGLNSDASIRKLKGANRPIVAEADRAALLSGMSCVGLIVLFDEETPESLVQYLLPDVLVKGDDHDPRSIAGGDAVRNRGGQVVTIARIEGLSTSAMVRRIRDEKKTPEIE